MQYRKVTGGYLLRLERGEEVIASLLEFVKKYRIKSGFLVGLGACEHLELGYFDAVKREYVNSKFPGEYEVTNLTGNISRLEGEPTAHIHVTLSDNKFAALAGHLWKATVSGTVEIFIHTFQAAVPRAKDPETGLNLLRLTKVK